MFSKIYKFLSEIDSLDLFKIVNHKDYILLIWVTDEKNWILIDLVDNKTSIQIYDNIYHYNDYIKAINDFLFMLIGANYEGDSSFYEYYSPLMFFNHICCK